MTRHSVNYIRCAIICFPLSLALSACSPSQRMSPIRDLTASTANLDLTPVSTPQPTPPPSPTGNVQKPPASGAYQKALDRADSARSISQSATHPDDWQLAASRWQQAINLLQQVSQQDVNYKYIKPHLSEFQQGLTIAQQRARGRKVQGTLQPAISADEKITTNDLITPQGDDSRSFQLPIKSRRDRIPVIDVTFNGGKQFEMMVDTGASGTMITPEMATALGIKAAGRAAIMTPAGRSSTNYGFVGQISAGSKSIYNTPVTIGPVALLGHDFFGDCEVAFRRDVIEFANCSI